MSDHIRILFIAGILDLILGDPSWLPHPVVGMGKTIKICENRIRTFAKAAPEEKKKRVLLSGGAVLVFCNLFLWILFPFLLKKLITIVFGKYGYIVEGILCFQLLAAKGLNKESMKVYQELKNKDIKKARIAVSRIVGRDTDNLEEDGVTKAAVETVAENLSDGVIAPMIFIAFGGMIGGYFYKAVNTMDSMIGYKDEKYLDLGKTAAKLDDVCNYIPARLSAMFLIIASAFCGYDYKNAWKMWKRDRRNHASPNSAQTEAAAAGALGIQLAGDAWYFGKLYKKKTIGDKIREVQIEDIKRINEMMYASSGICLMIFLLLFVVIERMIK